MRLVFVSVVGREHDGRESDTALESAIALIWSLMKKCPYCAEDIQDEAVVCKHCKRDLPGATVAKPRRKWPWIIGGIVVAFLVYSFLSTNRDAHEIVDGFTRSGVVESYSCDRSDPHVVVGPGWDTLRAQTQRGALNAFSMVCSVTEMSVRRK